MSRYERVYLVLCAFFIASLLIGNTLVFKAFDIPLPWLGTATLICGIIPYPITFLCTDLISELYGKKRADAVVIAGFTVSVYMLLIIQIGRSVPLSALQDPIVQEQYNAVFGQSVRAIFASMVAYLVAQLLDVRLFHFWKRLTKGRHLWLRNNGSTFISQLLDTVLVVSLLFGGVWSSDKIIAVIVSSYVFKLLIALADTPLMYLGAYLFKDIEEETKRRLGEV